MRQEENHCNDEKGKDTQDKKVSDAKMLEGAIDGDDGTGASMVDLHDAGDEYAESGG